MLVKGDWRMQDPMQPCSSSSGCGSSRQGRTPAGESPAMPVARVGHVESPHRLVGTGGGGSEGGAADHRRHHAGRGDPADPPASETFRRATPSCSGACPPGSLRLVLRLTAPGGSPTRPQSCGLVGATALGSGHAPVAPPRGGWVRRHDHLRQRIPIAPCCCDFSARGGLIFRWPDLSFED